MLFPFDEEYIATKEIMLGKASMPSEFDELAAYIDATFGVRTINIIQDTIDNGKTIRLNICFETEAEEESFHESGGLSNYDDVKQNMIASKYKALKALQSETITRKVFVCYSAFAPIAMADACESIAIQDTEALKEKLNNPDLWEINVFSSRVTFFLRTDEQVKKYQNSEDVKLWGNMFFELIKPNNEFNYLNKDTFFVYLDSKENFDKNYESNWYYYYK